VAAGDLKAAACPRLKRKGMTECVEYPVHRMLRELALEVGYLTLYERLEANYSYSREYVCQAIDGTGELGGGLVYAIGTVLELDIEKKRALAVAWMDFHLRDVKRR
jgi:hypothetical protein